MKLIHTYFTAITRDLARSWASMRPCPNDRPINPTRIALLEDDIKNGNAIVFNWASARVGDEDARYRINGKHSSHVLSTIDPFPADLVAAVQEYSCTDAFDLARLYAQFDGSANTRTQRDVNRAVQGLSTMHDIGKRVFDYCVTGITAARLGYQSKQIRRVQPEDRALSLVANEEFVRWYASLVNEHESARLLGKGAVVSAMFLTWQRDRDACIQFWTAVRNGTSQPDCPSRTLQRYLLQTACWGGGKWSNTRCDAPQRMEIRCLHAWNAWRRQEHTSLKCYGTSRPKIV